MWGDVAQAFSDGVHRVALSVAGFLPGVLTMLLVLAFSVGIAFAVRWGLRKSLSGIEFDRRVHRWGLTQTGEWAPRHSPTAIVAHSVFWFVLLVGFLAGLKSRDHRSPTRSPPGRSRTCRTCSRPAGVRGRHRGGPVPGAHGPHQRGQHADPVGAALSLGVKWLVVLFTIALSLQQLRSGARSSPCPSGSSSGVSCSRSRWPSGSVRARL